MFPTKTWAGWEGETQSSQARASPPSPAHTQSKTDVYVNINIFIIILILIDLISQITSTQQRPKSNTNCLLYKQDKKHPPLGKSTHLQSTILHGPNLWANHEKKRKTILIKDVKFFFDPSS